MGILDATRKGKQTDGEQMSILDQLQAELAGLALEDSACERTSTDYNASVDAIERALVRRQAIAVRTSVVERKIAMERVRVKEEERAALQAKGEALKAKTLASQAELLPSLVAVFNALGRVREGHALADSLLAQSWNQGYPYPGMAWEVGAYRELQLAIKKLLVTQHGHRFSDTSGGLIDTQGEAKE